MDALWQTVMVSTPPIYLWPVYLSIYLPLELLLTSFETEGKKERKKRQTLCVIGEEQDKTFFLSFFLKKGRKGKKRTEEACRRRRPHNLPERERMKEIDFSLHVFYEEVKKNLKKRLMTMKKVCYRRPSISLHPPMYDIIVHLDT